MSIEAKQKQGLTSFMAFFPSQFGCGVGLLPEVLSLGTIFS